MSFATYDFETYEWTKPFVFCVYSKHFGHFKAVARERVTEAVVVQSALQAMRDLCKGHGVTTFWAHNGGKFDVLFIIDALRHMPGWKCDGITAAGRVIILRVMAPDCTFELKDSYAVIQSSLSKALQSFEVPTVKTFTEDDYAKDMRKLSDARLLEGCLRDCEALYTLLERVESLAEGWGGQLKSTFSSTALSLLKAHIGRPLPSHKGQQWANEIARKAYHGGRVEVFRHCPNGAMRYYDISSSYPFSATQPLPWRLLGRDKPRLFDKAVRQIVFATVTVPPQYMPPLPFVPPDGGLFFPTGTWDAWFTSIELEYAIEQCGVTARLHEAISYSVETPFKSFIDTVFETKRTSTGAKREFAKLSMNGCIGKFGQRPENTKLKIFNTRAEGIAFAQKNEDVRALSEDWTALEVKTMRWAPHTHYALAGFVLANSRILLHQRAMLAESSSPKCPVCYVDTDSIQCEGLTSGLEGYVGELLGMMKVEVAEMDARYYAPKLYCYVDKATGKWTYKSKGFPVDGKAFERIIRGELVGNPKGRMQLVRTQLKNSEGGVIHLSEEETEKRWNGRSVKRRILPGEFGDTEPWTAEELIEGAHHAQVSPLAKNWAE